MKKLFEFLFGKKKEGKDHIKGHTTCDFDQKVFNHVKRDKKYVQDRNEEIERARKANPGKGNSGTTTDTGGTTTPPPPPPTTSSNNVILLVFDGITVSGTSWNWNGDIVAEPSGFDLNEQQAVLDYIKNMYAGKNVVITADKSLYNAAPVTRRMRVIFTETWDWFGQSGGVAYVNSFSWGNDTPCWVFSSLLAYNTKYCGDAGGHEAAHTLGCYHQSSYDAACNKTAEYRRDVILGVGYYTPSPQFIVGPNSNGCNTIQDDNKVINEKLA